MPHSLTVVWPLTFDVLHFMTRIYRKSSKQFKLYFHINKAFNMKLLEFFRVQFQELFHFEFNKAINKADVF